MEIYEVLKNDHMTVKAMLNELLTLNEDSDHRSDLIDRIKHELIPHSRAEEAVFYNSLRAIDAAKDVVRHSFNEHVEAEALLRTLQMKDKVDGDWKKTAMKLKEALEHHIAEEEGVVFNIARQVLLPNEAEQLAGAFEKMKAEVQDEGFMGTTMDLIVNLMPPRFAKVLGRSDTVVPNRKS